MKAKVTVLAVRKREWPATDYMPANTQYICQCLVHMEKDLVGVCKVDERIISAEEEVVPGDYIADFGIKVNYKTKDIESNIASFLRLLPGADASKLLAVPSVKSRVTVLAVEKIDYPKREKMPATTRYVCQCLVHGEEDLIGVIRINPDLVPGGVVAVGDYLADFGIKVDYKTKDIKSTVIEFQPMTAPAGKKDAPSIDKATGEVKKAA